MPAVLHNRCGLTVHEIVSFKIHQTFVSKFKTALHGRSQYPGDAWWQRAAAFTSRSGTFHAIADPREMHRDLTHSCIGATDRNLVK